MRGHVNTLPKHPAELNASLPLPLCAAIVKAMEKDPAARYQTATEFAADLAGLSYDEAQTIAQMSIIAPTIASLTPGGKPVSGSGTPTPGSDPARPSSKLQPSELDSVSRELAAYIGPIAKVVVKRAADRCSSVDELYAVVAGEIDTEKDRKRFLAGKKK